MADMGTLHSKCGEQVLTRYIHCGTTMLVGAVRHKLHRTQNTIKPPTCHQGLHCFCCVPNDVYTAPHGQQQEETVDVHTQHCPCKPSDA